MAVIKNAYGVVAAELLGAAQGISLTEEHLSLSGNDGLGEQTKKIYLNIRNIIPSMLEDRYIYGDYKKIIDFLLVTDPIDMLVE